MLDSVLKAATTGPLGLLNTYFSPSYREYSLRTASVSILWHSGGVMECRCEG